MKTWDFICMRFHLPRCNRQTRKDPPLLPGYGITPFFEAWKATCCVWQASCSTPALLLGIFWGWKGNFSPVPSMSETWSQTVTIPWYWAGRGWPWKWLALTPPPYTHSCKFIIRIFQSNQIHLFRGPLLWWLNLHHQSSRRSKKHAMPSAVEADLGDLWAEQLYKEIGRD